MMTDQHSVARLHEKSKQNLGFLLQAIQSVQQLRSTVTNVFGLLGEGTKPDAARSNNDDDDSSSSNNNNSRDGSKFLSVLQEYLQAVNKDYNEVEKHCNSLLAPMIDTSTMGPSAALSLDCVADRSNVYRDLCITYQWNQRTFEYALNALNTMQSHRIKRYRGTSHSLRKRRPIPQKVPQLTQGYIEGCIDQTFLRHFQDFPYEIALSKGDTRVIKLTIPRVFTAIIVLHSLKLEKVLVKGLDESFTLENGTIDMFTPSIYVCMRKITDNATLALLQFSIFLVANPNVNHPEILHYFLRWLQSYKNLFIEPCTACKKHIKDGLPPLWRDYRSTYPFHESCRNS